ncbi:MAG TPA: 3-isopropylmalate dehydrogenase [Dehalococcoidia bacterium]|nr:3-isopropylmalate dehydrogenase [Dehalococcoidia bacterium]
MTRRIVVLPGDGIGPEVTAEGIKILRAVERRFGLRFEFEQDAVGGASIDAHGTALRSETLERCRRAEAVLFGAVGGPKWDDPAAPVRPEDAILGLRKGLGLFANIRPVRTQSFLCASGPLRPEVVEGVDLVVIRELTGGIYFGRPKRRWRNASGRQAVDTLRYNEREVARIVRVAFEMARTRRRKVTSVDKANVMESGRLWREVTSEVARDYPDVALEHMLVDACAMHLIRRPGDFDVIVTENLFGDILTDEASVLAGSMGLLPSASLGRRRRDGTGMGLYEPIHGSAPDIAGQGRANPIAMILSVVMMLRLSFGEEEAARAVEHAVDRALASGRRTPDIASEGEAVVATSEMGDLVAAALQD